MTVALNIAEATSKRVTAEVECIDRVVSDPDRPLLQPPANPTCLFRKMHHSPVPSPVLMAPMPRSVTA